jgi:hypothetical protein
MLTSLRTVQTRIGRLLESVRQVAEDLVASFERWTPVGDQDRNAISADRAPQIDAILSTGGNLFRDEVDAEFRQALPHSVGVRTPFGLVQSQHG